MSSFWDASAALDRVLASPPRDHVAQWNTPARAYRELIFTGSWAARDWRNVPGPFFATETDTCGGGRAYAPNLVLVNEHWTEFVYRQPDSPAQVIQLVDAAYDDPFGGYGSDGNNHWTLELIRQWWSERGRLLQWIESSVRQMREEHADAEVVSLREFADDVRGPLEEHLRQYAYWLENRVAAQPGDTLPLL